VTLPPTILIEDTDFSSAWARAVRTVLRQGVPLTIGDATEPKPILDVCATVSLTENAIKQIENREIHLQYPFVHIDQYCEEFTRDYLDAYIKKPEKERFTYLYFDRLARYGRIDQLEHLCSGLAAQIDTNITSNRDPAVTWNIGSDIDSDASPCLQRIQVRYLGGHDVEVHLDWRSRDLYTAWQSNIIALVDMLNREVIRPDGCKIVKLVDHSSSLHIYKSDVAAAKDVKLVHKNPLGWHNLG